MFQLFLNERRAALIALGTVAVSVAALAGCGGSGAILGSTPAQINHAAGARGVSGAARVVTPMRTAIPLSVPIALAEDRHHNLYVGNAGTSQILIYNSKNVQLTADTISDAVDNPAGIGFDKAGNLYVVNRDTHVVTVYDPSRKRIHGRLYHTDKSNHFAPSGIAVDALGEVWVANRDDYDFNIGEVEIFDSAGHVIHTLTTNLQYPVGIAFRGPYAWVCDSTTPSGNALTVMDAHGRYIKTVSTPNFTPTYDAQSGGKLYVTNGLSADIAILDAAGKVLKVTNNKGLDLPYGIVFTSTGNFYVANVGNNTITEYNSRGVLIHTIK